MRSSLFLLATSLAACSTSVVPSPSAEGTPDASTHAPSCSAETKTWSEPADVSNGTVVELAWAGQRLGIAYRSVGSDLVVQEQREGEEPSQVRLVHLAPVDGRQLAMASTLTHFGVAFTSGAGPARVELRSVDAEAGTASSNGTASSAVDRSGGGAPSTSSPVAFGLGDRFFAGWDDRRYAEPRSGGGNLFGWEGFYGNLTQVGQRFPADDFQVVQSTGSSLAQVERAAAGVVVGDRMAIAWLGNSPKGSGLFLRIGPFDAWRPEYTGVVSLSPIAETRRAFGVRAAVLGGDVVVAYVDGARSPADGDFVRLVRVTLGGKMVGVPTAATVPAGHHVLGMDLQADGDRLVLAYVSSSDAAANVNVAQVDSALGLSPLGDQDLSATSGTSFSGAALRVSAGMVQVATVGQVERQPGAPDSTAVATRVSVSRICLGGGR